MLEKIKVIVPGRGCDSVLLIGSEKTAAVDAGMSYCSGNLVKLLERELSGRPLDYVFLTHSHYDHAGGVSGLRHRWPELTVMGSEHARSIFRRDGARAAIRRLSDQAAELYLGGQFRTSPEFTDYDADAVQVDEVIGGGDEVSLGGMTVRALFTPGHTNCSLSFFIPETKLIFPSESVGCYTFRGGVSRIASPFLTGFQATLDSIETCRRCLPEHIISPHHGLVREIGPEEYFDLARREAAAVRDYLLELRARGLSPEQMLEQSVGRFWESRGDARDEQPLPAFMVNMKATIQVVLRECAGESAGKAVQ